MIFKAMTAAGENGGLICMHAENGVVIDVLVKRAIEQGRTAPKYHALTRPTKAEAEGVHRAIAIAEMANSTGLHRAFELLRRVERSSGRARSRTARVCRDLPAIPAARLQSLREARF